MGASYKYYVPAESKEVSRGGAGESLAVALERERTGALPDMASFITCNGHVRINQINHINHD
jgi:hypothetical protein